MTDATMTTSDPAGDQRRLDESGDSTRCEAIAVSTGERCERAAVGRTGYCALHLPTHAETKAETRDSPVVPTPGGSGDRGE
jgi:hypothetical protein